MQENTFLIYKTYLNITHIETCTVRHTHINRDTPEDTLRYTHTPRDIHTLRDIYIQRETHSHTEGEISILRKKITH